MSWSPVISLTSLNPSGQPPLPNWPSTTNQPFPPQLDPEAIRRAVGVMSATIGIGNTAPIAAPGTYMGGRLAAGTPRRQPADLSGLAGHMPADMPALIDALLEPRHTNRGIVFGDTNHSFSGIPAILADPEALAAMRRNGITHLFMEVSPEWLRENNNQFSLLVRQARAAGITVVPMDMYGPGVAAMQTAISDLANVSDPAAMQTVMQRFIAASEVHSIERQRVTNQVWVPRILEIMRANPNGRFIVLGGDAHISNQVLMNVPDINYEDLDESLARQLGAPVPYVRLQADPVALSPAVRFGTTTDQHTGSVPTRDTPDLVMQVPDAAAQRVRRAPFLTRPAVIRREALNAYRDLHSDVTTLVTELVQIQPRAPLQSIVAFGRNLGRVENEALEGRFPQARQALIDAAHQLETLYPLEGATAERVGAIRRVVRQRMENMRRTLDRLEALYAGREPPPAPRLSIPSSISVEPTEVSAPTPSDTGVPPVVRSSPRSLISAGMDATFDQVQHGLPVMGRRSPAVHSL